MSHKVLLSPMDQFVPSRHVRVLLAFPNDDPETAIVSLNSGLRTTCAKIPHLKGTLYQSDHQGYVGVAWSDSEPSVQLAGISVPDDMPTYAELAAEGFPDRYLSKSLFPPMAEAAPSSGAEVPVFRVSYAIIRGGFLLCIYFHHNVMDGAGAADLLNIWAANTRSDDSIATSTVLEDLKQRNTLLQKALFPNDIPPSSPNHAASISSPAPSKPDLGRVAPSNIGTVSTSRKLATPPVTLSLFVFKGSKLESLQKALAPASSGKPITKNTLISAMVWARVALIRSRRQNIEQSKSSSDGLPNTFKSSIIMAVNLRKQVFDQSEPKQLFLGNLLSTIPTALSIPDSDLSNLTSSDTTEVSYPTILPYVTSAICTSCSNLSSQLASRMYKLAATMPDVRAFRATRAPFNGTDLVVTSWMNFPFYPDFGGHVGTPAYVRLPNVGEDADGLLVVLPRRRRIGGLAEDIEIMVALREDDMRELERDEVFVDLTRRDILGTR